jgi:hypothetical protein
MLHKLFLPTMLMIGGSGRNVGKTTLICAIMRKFASATQIIGLKVTSIRPGEKDFHGHHDTASSSSYQIIEEQDNDSEKDTARMLRAGAKKVYYLQTTDDQLSMAMKSFFDIEDQNSIIICETRNLSRIIKPGIFVLISDPAHDNFKANSSEFFKTADLHLEFDHKNRVMETYADLIILEDGKWRLNVK